MITLMFLICLVVAAAIVAVYIVAAVVAVAIAAAWLVVAVIVAVAALIGLVVCGVTGTSSVKRWVDAPARVVRIESNPVGARTKYTAVIAVDLGGATEQVYFPTDIRFSPGTRLVCTVSERIGNDGDTEELKITSLDYASSRY